MFQSLPILLFLMAVCRGWVLISTGFINPRPPSKKKDQMADIVRVVNSRYTTIRINISVQIVHGFIFHVAEVECVAYTK